MEFNYEKPLNVTLFNKGADDTFVPYGENFVFPIKSNGSVILNGLEPGQALYYIKQSSKNIVTSLQDQDAETSLVDGTYNSSTGVFTNEASFNQVLKSTTVEKTQSAINATMVYDVYGTLPYVAADSAIGMPAGNRFTVRLSHPGITSRDDLPSGDILSVQTIGGSGASTYKKSAFETDGSIIIIVNIHQEKEAVVIVKWLVDDGVTTTYTYDFKFDNAVFGENGEEYGNVTAIDVKIPMNITLTNTSKFSVGFVPYKQNFVTYIEKNDSITITTEKVEEALYYLNQENKNIEITY